MTDSPQHDAVVVGAGPNGLSAAIELARAGLQVLLLERASTVGGAMRSGPATEPGFVHDHCAAVHPMGVLSPFWSRLPLERHGLTWLPARLSAAHPLEDGPAALLGGSLADTADRLERDGRAYRKLLRPLLAHGHDLLQDLLGPPIHWPKRPMTLARFGLAGLRSARGLARARFRDPRARALFAGCAAHSILPLDFAGTAAVGLVFCLTAHLADWPVAAGGSQTIADALADYLRELGGRIECDHPVRAMTDLPPARAYLFDLAPRQVLEIAGSRLGGRYHRALERYVYGPAVYKVDYALSQPIPWTDPACADASTVHMGGDLDDVTASEAAMWRGSVSERPFVMVCQQSHFDAARAPDGQHTGYAYIHVPHGDTGDHLDAIENQFERFAPGFRDIVLARRILRPGDLEADNPALIGGVVAGGATTLRQLIARPALRWSPYTTPDPALFLCGASTPPGGGVHGMCGFHAARAALRRVFRKRPAELPAAATAGQLPAPIDND